jgi:hypothetical protein
VKAPDLAPCQRVEGEDPAADAELAAADAGEDEPVPCDRRADHVFADARIANHVGPNLPAGRRIQCDEPRVIGAAKHAAIQIGHAAIALQARRLGTPVDVMPYHLAGHRIDREGASAGRRE